MKRIIPLLLSLILLLSACGKENFQSCGKENFQSRAKVILINTANSESSDMDTYIAVFMSDTTLKKISENLDFNITEKQLKKSLTIKAVPDTRILEIIISYEDKEKSKEILNCLLEEYPTILKEIFPTVSFSVVSLSSDDNDTFTNKYGTATTQCAHIGCEDYIAKSGDTNCCPTHSRKCLECNCFIDEDAAYCMDCIKSALK